ncbi:MAG: hypothetical protein K5910_08935 [Bacteroidales bacterium]|nr:hypothetical protein [Bacteroidales bacterium]
MVHYFQVAGLTFSLDLPDKHPSLSTLSNYDPFRVAPVKEEELLFSVSLVREAPDGGRECVFHAPEETGEPVVNLFRYEGGDWLAEFSPVAGTPICGQVVFSADFRHGHLYTCGSPAAQTFAINNALMLLFAFASARHSALEMHASVVMHGGRGFLFLGRSGTGKSTHSSLWLKHIEDTELLNDDNPVLRVVDGQVRVWGTPWSGKTPCYKAKDVPVGAIVRLSQAPHNAIVRLDTVPAYASVMSSCSGFRPIREISDAQHETLSVIATQVPCFHLECLPDEDAARLCQNTVDG